MAGLDCATRLGIEHACQRLSIAYANLADSRRYDDFAELFAEGAVLDTGVPLHSKAEIRRAMSKRPDRLRSRHVMTNILIDVIDETHASGVSYLTLFRHIGDGSTADLPVNSTLPAGVGHYEDDFVLTEQGWKIARRVLHLAFRNPEAFPDK
jgi:3-phenylpropionate/cinnamic acid dioxygenase small subunit